MAGIDPEFLAALPEELQAEVLEANRRERRQRRAEAEHAAAQVRLFCSPIYPSSHAEALFLLIQVNMQKRCFCCFKSSHIS